MKKWNEQNEERKEAKRGTQVGPGNNGPSLRVRRTGLLLLLLLGLLLALLVAFDAKHVVFVLVVQETGGVRTGLRLRLLLLE